MIILLLIIINNVRGRMGARAVRDSRTIPRVTVTRPGAVTATARPRGPTLCRT